jgi:hypothetical protein
MNAPSKDEGIVAKAAKEYADQTTLRALVQPVGWADAGSPTLRIEIRNSLRLDQGSRARPHKKNKRRWASFVSPTYE